MNSINKPISALTIFGGFASELAPADLPAGPAVVAEDVDFDSVGAVRTRDGIQSIFSFPSSAVSQSASSGANVAAFGEGPWINPNNITTDTPGTPASIRIGGSSPGIVAGTPALDSSAIGSGVSGLVTGPITPTQVDEFALFIENPQNSTIFTPTGGPGPWTAADPSDLVWWQELPNTTPFSVTATYLPNPSGGVNTTLLATFKTAAGTSPAIAHTPTYLNWGSIYHNAVTTTAGSLLLVAIFTSNSTLLPTADISLTDDQGNIYTAIGTSYNNPQQITLFQTGPIPGGTIHITVYNTAGPSLSETLACVVELAGINAGGTGLDTALAISEAMPTTGPVTTTLSLTPSTYPSFAILGANSEWGGIFSVDGSWTNVYPGGANINAYKSVTSGDATATVTGLANRQGVSYVMGTFAVAGATPTLVQNNAGTIALPGTLNLGFPSPVQTGSAIIVIMGANSGTYPGWTPTANVSISDNFGNVYVKVGQTSMLDYFPRFSFCCMWCCTNAIGGADLAVSVTADGDTTSIMSILNFTNIGVISYGTSQALQASYNFNIPPATIVTGIEVLVSGHQTFEDDRTFLTATLGGTSLPSPTVQFQLPTSDGQVTLEPTDPLWGQSSIGASALAALINSNSLVVNILANADVITKFSIYDVSLKLLVIPEPGRNFNYIKTFEETDGTTLTLALDALGILYQEDVYNTPGELTSFYSSILPNSFASSVTVDDREFIAFSDLLQGTDMPRQYDGTNFNRLSQVGPGVPPTIAQATSVADLTAAADAIAGNTDYTARSQIEIPAV